MKKYTLANDDIQKWIDSDKELSDLLVEIQNLNISINEQVEITFHRISDLYSLPKMPENIEHLNDEDTYDEEFEQTSVYEQFGLLKYLHDDQDLRGVLLSAIYLAKNGYVTDIDEVYKKYYSKNKLPIVGIC